MSPSSPIFEKYRSALMSQPLSLVWQGYGSAIFLEFGRLFPRVKRDGSPGNSEGDYTVMIQWSWRVESEDAILCGSWNDEQDWEPFFKSMIGRKVQDVALFGRLPELSIALSDGFWVSSFMTAEGNPEWTIFDRSIEQNRPSFISVRGGKVCEDLETDAPPISVNGDFVG